MSSRLTIAARRTPLARTRETALAMPRQARVMSIIQKSMRNITMTPPATVKPLMTSWARLCESAIFASEVSETVRVRTSPCCCLLYADRSTRSSRLVSSIRTS